MTEFKRLVFFFLRIFSHIYFRIVGVIFVLINYLHKKESVEKAEDNLLLISATDAAEMIRTREITSADLIETYINRIKVVNPLINAIVTDNLEEALKEAERVDAYLDKIDRNSDEFANLPQTKPLLGVPFTVKDTFAVEGFRWTGGLVCRQNKIATDDVEVVRRVKESGAILLGITNVPEAAMWTESNNQLFGRTKNPYDLRRAAGGSSGGEGALIAAAGSVIGIGSDIGGSIRIPSIFNGIFGLKPTELTVPFDGSFPTPGSEYQKRMLNVGPMCRYAKDLPIFLKVIVGDEIASGLMKLSQQVSVRKTRFFYMEGFDSPLIQPIHNSVRNALRKTVKYFEKKYDTCVYKMDFSKAHTPVRFYVASMHTENAPKFNKIITDYTYDAPIFYETLKCLFGKSEHTAASLLVSMVDCAPSLPIESKRDQLRREIIDLLGDDGLLIFPSYPEVAPFHNKPLFTPLDFSYTALFNTLRLPVVVCPLGLNSEGIPISVQIVGAPYSERLLIAAAADLEEGFGGWKSPRGTKSEFD
ncbi:hypothetical protein FO519_008139 [Halicephalobus sp. NKZ332]|nr:hypothetical protein FO519_008139 [Halicephalobus sp. NKZ332]